MAWRENQNPDLDRYLILFKDQHKKYTPAELLTSLNIEDFDRYLEEIWLESIKMLNEGHLKCYKLVDDNGIFVAFIFGNLSSDRNIFNIRHFNSLDIESTSKDIFQDFLNLLGVESITIRSRKGIPEYHKFIIEYGFQQCESITDYNLYIF